MPRKHDYEYIKNYIESFGCELLSELYTNNVTKLKIKFICGHIDEDKTFSDFRVIKRKICSDCSSDKFSYEYVKEYIESFGCKLISDTYESNGIPLEILFTCGHKGYRSFEKFKSRKGKICRKCAGNSKYEQNEIEEELLSCGYRLIGIYKNAQSHLTIVDSDGYKYYTTINNFRYLIVKSNGKFSLASKDNPYTLENIKLWLLLNNKSFSLNEKTSYTRAKEELVFDCHICTEVFDSSWDQISVQGTGCPYCAGKRVGRFNNLAVNFPVLAEQWDYQKNFPLTPYQVSSYSNKSVWWICPNGHSFDSMIGNRAKGIGCRFCSGREATSENNFALSFPELLEEWDYEKNAEIGLFPETVTPKSHYSVYWVCKNCGNRWESPIQNRAGGSGCRRCNMSNGVKRIDIFLRKNNFYYSYDQEIFKDLYGDYGKRLRYDFVIYKNELKKEILGIIEWDGGQHDRFIPHFHGSLDKYKRLVKYDQIKNEYASAKGINLVRIKEKDYKNIEKILEEALNLKPSLEAIPVSIPVSIPILQGKEV